MSHAAKNFSKLSMRAPMRRSVLNTMATQVLEHQRIETTFHKAKATQRVVEKFITRAKRRTLTEEDSLRNQVRTPKAFELLWDVYAERYADRDGGYTRVLRTRRRKGDGALMAFIELVDRPGELRPAKIPPKRKAKEPQEETQSPKSDD